MQRPTFEQPWTSLFWCRCHVLCWTEFTEESLIGMCASSCWWYLDLKAESVTYSLAQRTSPKCSSAWCCCPGDVLSTRPGASKHGSLAFLCRCWTQWSSSRKWLCWLFATYLTGRFFVPLKHHSLALLKIRRGGLSDLSIFAQSNRVTLFLLSLPLWHCLPLKSSVFAGRIS